MITPRIHLELDRDARHYQPGESLTGRFFAEGPRLGELRAAELSVLWCTAGKGEEDLAVHFFERYVPEGGARLDLRTPRPFHVPLPHSPLSYDGVIVKICWCARLRLFLPRGQEAVAETPFQLGNVASAEPVK
jgi:hypothetical protein